MPRRLLVTGYRLTKCASEAIAVELTFYDKSCAPRSKAELASASLSDPVNTRPGT
jgi:hypothetical protein